MAVAQTRLEILQICKLLQCVRENDEEQIKKLTDSGVPNLINYNEPNDGETALSTAAVRNMDTMIAFLLKLGAHPDVADFKGRTAVMRAAEFGHVQCMEELAMNKADMKIRDLEGKGILFYCLSPTQRHTKCLNIALQYGADVNNRAKDGTPILMYAAERADEVEDMVLLLLKKGADPTGKQDKTNRTALMAGCKSGSAKVVRTMLELGAHTVINTVQLKPKIIAAHEAARTGSLECLTALSSYGAKFDQYDEGNNNPIHYAAASGNAMCCKFLAQRGCNPKPKNSDGNQPKAIAKENGHKDAMKECRKGEKIFGKTGKNNEPWALSLYDFCYARADAVREAFQKLDGENTNTLNRDDFLDCLETQGAPLPDEDDIKKLIAAHTSGRDSDVNYEEFLSGKKYVNKLYLMSAFEGKKKKKKGKKGGKKKGKTKIPVEICTQADGPRTSDGGPPQVFVPRHIHYTDTGRFDRDRPPQHPLEDDSGWYLHKPDKKYMNVNDATKHADLDTLKDALSRGVSIDIRDKYFKTPLMIACVNGNMEVIKFLVERGANIHATDNFKWTPLHFACHAGILDVVEYLLERGADMEARTLNEATPLMRAIETSKPELVQYLIDRGAKVQIENRKGQTPLDLATSWGDFRVYDIVKTKVDSLPPPPDKKKGGKGGAKGGAKGGGKRPKSSASGDGKDKGAAAATKPSTDSLEDNDARRKGSILRAASALAGGIEEVEDITYVPRKTWTKQPTSQELIKEREQNRERFGWEVDFHDFKMPFLKNVDNRVIAEGGFDDDD